MKTLMRLRFALAVIIAFELGVAATVSAQNLIERFSPPKPRLIGSITVLPCREERAIEQARI